MPSGTTTTTRANDPRLDSRITRAILSRVAAGESFPDATRTVAAGAVEEARQEGMRRAELEFAASHVARLGADLMAGVADLLGRGGPAAA